MNMELLEQGIDYLQNFAIPVIDENTNFWMIRSKGGYFYDEFIRDAYIALGWNYINQNTVINSQTIEILKDGIKNRYGDKIPMVAINKCKRFINEINAGDYVIIPNAGSSKIAFCKIGEYFEEGDDDYRYEIETIAKIDNKECEVNEIKCPYRKRRKMEVLLQVSSERVGYNILKALSSYHGLSCMNDYATDILSCIYDSYEYKSKIVFNVNVGKTDAIRPRELAGFMYGITGFFESIADEDALSVTLNLNSPGKTRIILEKGFKVLKKKVMPLVAMYIFVVGGSGFGFELPGLLGFIKEARTLEISIEKEQLELDAQKLDNYQKAIQLIKDAEESGINVEEALRNIETLDELNLTMNFQSNEVFANNSNKEQ